MGSSIRVEILRIAQIEGLTRGALLIATVVVMTVLWFAPASSFLFKAAGWALIHLLLPAAHYLSYLGVATPGSLMGLGTPPWNPGSRRAFGNSFQDPQEPVIDAANVVVINHSEKGPWWDWSWWLSNGIAVARSLGSWGARQAKAIYQNEMKFVRCFEANRFSAEVIRLTAGTRFHTIATYVAPATEILPALSVWSDVPAIALKASRSGHIGGTEIVYASGINAGLKRLAGRAVLRSVGDKLTPAMAVTFAFTTGYNISIAAGCRISNPRL